MNAFYSSFIETAKHLASKHGLSWDMQFDDKGKISKGDRWDLAKTCGLATPPFYWLSSVSLDEAALEVRSSGSAFQGLTNRCLQPMPTEWQDFYKATILHELLIKKNRPPHALLNIARPIKILAVFADQERPWEVSSSTIKNAYNAALLIGESGKTAINFKMFVRILIDKLHLSNNHPLETFCAPFADPLSILSEETAMRQKRLENTNKRTARIKKSLEERSSPDKLPESKAFWELMRIVFTEKPKSFSDAIRFCQIKLAVCTGLRIGELVNIPKECLKRNEYIDSHGRSPSSMGGVSHSYALKYFAEKAQEDAAEHGHSLHEAVQHIPDIFEDIVCAAINDAARLTSPLRKRLAEQVRAGRILPEYEPQQLVPAYELYCRATGSLQISNAPIPPELTKAYQDTFDASILDEIYQQQLSALWETGPSRRYCEYWERASLAHDISFRKSSGQAMHSFNWKLGHVKAEDFEEFIRKHSPTKLSETSSFSISGSATFAPSEMLFLMPIRAISETRDGGILDVNRYMAVGRSQPIDLQLNMGGRHSISIFSRYCLEEKDKELRINPHALRHLQHGELFRLGVADTVLSHHFNRKGVAQSHTYDHRNLSEELDAIEIPNGASEIAPKAKEVLKMIMSQKVRGPIVDAFLEIQRDQGDDVAFSFLSAEADGLHVTPYGFCINSFTVDPCPKHLECFNGCRHLTRTELPEEERNLRELRERMQAVVKLLESRPEAARNPGWKNQLSHARTSLDNLEIAINTKPGEHPFLSGESLFEQSGGGQDSVLDSGFGNWRPD